MTKPEPLDYQSPRPTGLSHDMPAVLALNLGFLNVFWLALGLVVQLAMRTGWNGGSVAWLVVPGVVVSSVGGLVLARKARPGPIASGARGLNLICLLLSGAASILFLATLKYPRFL